VVLFVGIFCSGFFHGFSVFYLFFCGGLFFFLVSFTATCSVKYVHYGLLKMRFIMETK